jgi:hypothetical protein
MDTEQMAQEVANRLNRPDDDDLFDFPGEYYRYLSQAHRKFYGLFASHKPDLIYQATTATSSDGGRTFVLDDDHYGEMLVFESPGPPDGRPLVPSMPEGNGQFWIEGRNLRFLYSQSSPIYIRWCPATVADLDGDSDSVLPAYCDDAIIEWACYLMAQKPGFLGNPQVYKDNAMREWRGDDDNPSDMGILGIISRQSAHNPWEGDGGIHRPWYSYIR